MSDTVHTYGSVQKDAGTPPSNGAVRVEKGAEGLSNLALIGGLAILLAGVGLYAGVKTWLSWRDEETVFGRGLVQHVTNSHGMVGLIPVLLGGFGLISSVLFYRFSRYNKSPGAGRLCALGIGLAALAIAYGSSLIGLERHTHKVNFDWHFWTLRLLDEGIWPQLESASIGVMSIGGIACGAGVVGRGLLYWRRKDT
jgi:hypothetical protein